MPANPQLEQMNDEPWWVYVVELFEIRGFYVGITTELDRRVQEHVLGFGALVTQRYRVLRLSHYELHWGFQPAQEREKEVSRHLKAQGLLVFGDGISKKALPASCTQHARRDVAGKHPLSPDLECPQWWQVRLGKRPIEFPPWPEVIHAATLAKAPSQPWTATPQQLL